MSKADVDAVGIASKQRHLYLLNRVKNGQALTKAELEELAEHEKKSKEIKATAKEQSAVIAPDQIIEGAQEAAKYAGVSPRTIRRWVQEGMFVGKRAGKKIYIKNMLDVFRLQQGKDLTEDRKREQKADADYKTIKTQLLELELKIKQGQLVAVETLERERITRILAVKRAFLGLGRNLAPQLSRLKDPRKIQARINDAVREIIESFTK